MSGGAARSRRATAPPGRARCGPRTATSPLRPSCPSARTPRSSRCTPTRYARLGAEILLCNALPPHSPARASSWSSALGGLHAFMGWDGPILTDSGGYQLVSLEDRRASVDDDGATFVSPYDGTRLRVTPRGRGAAPGAAGQRRDHGARPAGGLRRLTRRGPRGGDGAHPPLGGALPGGHPGRRPAALRHRPGRVRPRAAARSRRGWSRGWTSTASPSAVWPWGSRSR